MKEIPLKEISSEEMSLREIFMKEICLISHQTRFGPNAPWWREECLHCAQLLLLDILVNNTMEHILFS
jgi:hypothetical protein